MEPLPDPPPTFRDSVEVDLRRGARLIIKHQDEIDWNLRLATPEGDYHLAVTMPSNEADRKSMLRRLETFMQWKQVMAFCLVVEVHEPDSVYAAGFSKTERIHCLSRITRTPKPWTAANFGPVEWLPEAAIDLAVAALLPVVARAMIPKEIAALQKWPVCRVEPWCGINHGGCSSTKCTRKGLGSLTDADSRWTLRVAESR